MQSELMKLRVIYWTSDDCDGQVDLSVGQVILFPYFDHCLTFNVSDFIVSDSGNHFQLRNEYLIMTTVSSHSLSLVRCEC